MKKEYNSLDFLKFILAICIVAIHANLLNIESGYPAWLVSSVIFRLGVPFFFVVSGYFLADKVYRFNRDDKVSIKGAIKDYCKKFFPQLIFWGGVGLLLEAWTLYQDGKSVLYILIYACRTIFYPLNAMWYLWASIIGAIILGFIYIHFKNWKWIWIIYSLIGYAVVLICNNYFFLVENTFLAPIVKTYIRACVSARNGVFLAPVFLSMGFLLRDKKAQLQLSQNKKVPIITTCIGAGLLLFEAVELYPLASMDDRGYFVAQLVLVPSVVSVGILFNMKIHLPYKLLRRLSTTLFLTHETIIRIIKMTNIYNGNTIVLFFATLVIALAIALISYQFKRRPVAMLLG